MNKIFAITVNYNSGEKIVRLVRQLIQLPSLTRIIVVDNASQDQSLKKLLKIKSKKLLILKNQTNKGFTAGVNQGVKLAFKTGATHILLVNPDLKIPNEGIKKLLATNFDIVGPVLRFQRQDKRVYDFGGKVNWVLGRTTHLETTDYTVRTTDSIDYISGACKLIKKTVFDRIGFLDKRFFLYFEDADFDLRAQKAGFTVAIAPNVIVSHAISEHRYSHNQFKIKQLLKSNLAFINKWISWYFRPLAYSYWLLLAVKSIFFSPPGILTDQKVRENS